jgi:hypothetical protein
MSESISPRNTPAVRGPSRGIRDALFMMAAAFITLRAGHASADESFVVAADRLTPDFGGSWNGATPLAPQFILPATYQVPNAPDARNFSTQDFRPRKPAIFEEQSNEAPVEDQPMLRGTTVWQRLKDYRSHGRVCLLTLWETGGSSVSLQAGKKGEPSLQWTSHAMNRGGGTRGLLDHLVSVSVASATRTMHSTSPAAGADVTNKPAKLVETGNGPKR